MKPILTLRTLAPNSLEAFYTEILGFKSERSNDDLILFYDDIGAQLIFTPSDSPLSYQHTRNDYYWKIGITLPNVEMAYAQLNAKGLDVSKPRQFRDIGYMCHLSDPAGFQIELLQHTFEGQSRTSGGNPNLPLGGGAQIGQITIRTTEIDKELAHYRNQLGMKLLSVQPVTEYGFDLFFLAHTEEVPPDPNLKAVSNRPWLWQRPYTTLEIQHYLDGSVELTKPLPSDPGFLGISFGKE